MGSLYRTVSFSEFILTIKRPYELKRMQQIKLLKTFPRVVEPFFHKNVFINPSDSTERIAGFPEVCITTFSENIIKDFTENNESKIIANLYSANGIIPVYEIEYAEERITWILIDGN